MNSYIGRYTKSDPRLKHLIGFKRKRDRNLALFSIFGCIFVYFAVYFSEEREKNRRHNSIEKDIERERWRAQELGKEVHHDDGFAEKYIEQEQQKRKDPSAYESIWKTLTVKKEAETELLQTKSKRKNKEDSKKVE
ncbi:hypothetical protein AGDE_02041 [Angomonas deanei]|uniref:Uncharacterized protein n=1 Tax=Angomonas deanei TaxID=59799 RepID=A0A7G2CLT8_9TRYP|nr:hypothetical protein AGDE_02041 [Angomonas deanei]CAD2220389.1 hypothetical protein, conserved [Angomonas deanei]|eukprot:EPY41882.1 hypothetical protein AGDE_02041 [Angomonas deanei]